MKCTRAKRTLRAAANIAATLTFLTALTPTGLAQQPNTGLRPDPESRVRAEHQAEMDIRREALLKGPNPTDKSVDQKRLQALTAQIKQDFERLWNINGEMMAAASAATGPDYGYLVVRLTEVKSRATRLQNTLWFPKPEIDQETKRNSLAPNREELRAMLSKLNDRIVSFVTNPYFRNPKVFDNELITKAGRDLEIIIILSRSIRKSSETLNRVLEKAP
jgi:hypothetical protein